jgi:DNA-binding Lrp family transcriptional regulator
VDNLDELDVRIFRALLTDKVSAPFSAHLKTSLREVARKLKVDDVTVRNRFKRFQDQGFLSGWRLLPNPTLFGYRMMNVLVDTQPKSPKNFMMERLKLIPGIVVLLDYQGDSLGIVLFYESDQSLSQTIELISKITSAEKITQFRAILPIGQANRFTDADWAIIRNMEHDAWKSHVEVAKELGYTARTVKNRLERLERQNALVIPPALDIASIDRMIGLVLYYSYTSRRMKQTVDRTLLSHFDGSYLWARLTDPEGAYLILLAPTMASVKQYQEWTRQQPGVAGARAEIIVESFNLWENTSKLFQQQTLLKPTLKA